MDYGLWKETIESDGVTENPAKNKLNNSCTLKRIQIGSPIFSGTIEAYLNEGLTFFAC